MIRTRLAPLYYTNADGPFLFGLTPLEHQRNTLVEVEKAVRERRTLAISYGCGKVRRRKKQNKEGNEDMKLSYTELVKRPALLHRLSGLTVKEFEALLESFSAQYDQLVIQPRVSAPGRQRAVGGGQKG